MAEEDFSSNIVETRFRKGELLGKYRIEAFSAFSSTGEIYSAVDEEKRQECSLHVISSAISGNSPDVAARLLEKAEKATFFRHRAFCSVTGTFTLGDIPVIVTEPLRGKLLSITVKLGKCDTAFTGKIAAELQALIEAAKSFPDLIFDFTPDNIFVEGDRIKVIYPGILSSLHLCSEGSFAKLPVLQRSAAYIAPEVLWENARPGYASNIYASGVLLFFLYTSSLPFAGKNVCETVLQSLDGLSCSDPAVPPRMRGVLKTMLAADPRERYTGAGGRNAPGGEIFQKIRKHRKIIFAVLFLCVLITVCCKAVSTGCEKKKQVPPYRTGTRNVYRKHHVVQNEGKKRAVLSSVPRKDSPSSTPVKAAEKTPRALVLPRHFLASHAAVPQGAQLSLEERRNYSLLRLKQLEKEAPLWKKTPVLEDFYNEKVQFRKKIFLNLSAHHREAAGADADYFSYFSSLPPTAADLERFLLNGNSVTAPERLSPLSCAAAAGRSDLIRLLLCADASPEHADSSGWTPLFYAYAGGDPQCIRMLLDAGAD
ncbi:MAG: ankyrin repeat domain-containing protein, partial [Lentisphaeria bacterium]|nr:ankyrin repeat domain-containing protein [Lentisphaeria bacterium]